MRINYRPTPLIIVSIILLALFGLGGFSPQPATAAAPDGSTKIDAEVLQALKNSENAEFFIVLRDQADLSGAASFPTKEAKGQYVFETLRAHSERTQAPIRALLNAQGVAYQAFYISNKIYVPTGSDSLVTSLANRDDVARITANQTYQLPEPLRSDKTRSTSGIEPNLTFVGADQVWSMGITGDGVVLAGNDTGIQWDHPALKNQYRGWNGSSVNHNYSWWDATGTYSTVPGDGYGHGTHISGTMAGDDGGTNQIGIAPEARLIHCKNLDDGGSGSDAQIIECFQWDLAPWDLTGNNPRPDLAPDAINNSWGGWGGNPTFQPEIEALQAAGILVEFSAGNAGPGCYTLGSPSDFDPVITTGSVNHTSPYPGTLTWFSSRGPSPFTDTPIPDVMAPGEDIRSSLPGSTYAAWSGTSMSGPHVTGLVGLLWSANPGLRGFVEETQFIIMQTAVPLSGQTGSNCGGDYDEGPNNDWGNGTIDALAAVNAAMQFGSPGTLTGTVTDSATEDPLPGAVIRAALSPEFSWKRSANQNGIYNMVVFSGTYTVTASLYGYYPESVPGVSVHTDETTTLGFALDPAPLYTVTGEVQDAVTGWPLYASIAIAGYPGDPVWTDPLTGEYSIDLAAGVDYIFTVTSWVDGYQENTRPVGPLTVEQEESFDLIPDPLLCSAPGYQNDFTLFEDFEGGDGGFTVEGTNATWEWGTPTGGPGAAHSGSSLWGTNLSGNYNDNEISFLVSPIIDLSPYSGKTLIISWWQWLQTESCCDFATVDMSSDGGFSWTTFYWNTDDSLSSWQKQTIVLEEWLITDQFQIRFGLTTDFSITFPGFYIDDLGFGIADTPPALYTEDFEASDGSYFTTGLNNSWEWGLPTRGPGSAHSGQFAWATDLDGNYNNGERSRVLSPSIDLSGAAGEQIVISWWQWMQTETGYDTIDVDASINGGLNWTSIYGPLSGPIDQNWTKYTVVLDPSFAVEQFRLRVALRTDETVTYPGFYLDDVQIAPYSDAPPALPCDPQSGGLVVGHVRDLNTGLAINAAAVTSAVDSVQTQPTLADPNLEDGFYVLFAPESNQEIEASKSKYLSASDSLVITAGTAHALDLYLAAGLLSSDPVSLAVTLEMGETADQNLTLQNQGGQDLSFTLLERTGDFLPTAASAQGQGTWLYQAAAGISLENNQRGTSLAYPASYRWEPTTPSQDLNILMYVDDPNHAFPNTYPDQALQTLGLPYTAHYDADFEGFRSSLNSGTVWDIIIFADENYGPPDNLLNSLNTYVLSGGRLIFHSWVVGFDPNAALYSTLGFTWSGDDNDPPDPIFWWEPSHPVFNQPMDVPEWLSLTGQIYGIYGQRVEPFEGVPALAGYTQSGPEPGQAALLIGNEGRTVFRGFLDGQNDADLDGDGWQDGVELWINLLEGIQTDFSTDVTWLTTDVISGTIPSGADLSVLVSYDAGAAEITQPGTYQAILRMANDTPYGALAVPVDMTVNPPAGWGKLGGTITGLQRCDVPGGPLRNAAVVIDGLVDLNTRGDGVYGYWMPAGSYNVSISRSEFVGQEFDVVIQAGVVTTIDIDLRRAQPCAMASPSEITALLKPYTQTSVEVDLSNLGAVDLAYSVLESPFALEATAQLRSVADAQARGLYTRQAQSRPTSLLEQLARTPGEEIRAPSSGWYGGSDNPGGAVRYAFAQCTEEPEAFYIISGVDSFFGVTKAAWRYDATLNSWTSLVPIPTGQEAPAGVCYDGRLYVMGGGGTDQFYIFDLYSREWLAGAPLPRGAEGAAAGVWNGKIYLIGGDNDFFPGSGVSNEVNIYDIASDTWVGAGSSMPIAASNAGFVQAGPHVYVVGGWGIDTPEANVQATQRYNMETDGWEVGPDFFSGRADFALAATNQALYAMGGDANSGYYFDPTRQVERLGLEDWPNGDWSDFGDPLPVALTSNSAGFCTSAVFNADHAEFWSVGGFDTFSISGRNMFHEVVGETCYQIFSDVPWISVSPPSGAVSADGQTKITVTLDATPLGSGEHKATLIIVSNDRQIRIPVTVFIEYPNSLFLPFISTK